MEPVKRGRGRPRKPDTDGTPEKVKKRQYMRNYVSGIKKGIVQLEQDELDCLKDLEHMRTEKSKLINMLDDANKQAGDILTAKVAKPVKKMARPANISLPKPKPKRAYAKSTSDDILMTYLKDEGARTLQGAVKRRLAKK
jgi:soluble cytochrome b562